MLLTYAQITISVLLIVSILLQQKGSAGLSSTFGGSSMEYSTKRGAEKVLFYATIVLAVLFLAISITRLLL
ncbi:MAG: preprotein translocase subunit SecG [Candidatus Yanofskybacteria bacterium RIFCSPHIGHO2_02_FULL_44_12b]|uniref:Protein-export membrane protein SecG n=1 Tax=Candidatus Yanofskybacteria bacterium RIFCSPLOWO2_01_FULL_44_22 TaxID=1802697 RepID=A0A1F8GQJ7_9BACT|nr:MAG: preprotein translocase subunit SecG [Candidatus Yanofskybacteria bacterium RIFCSPHIGHO2_01_FULL_44_24]OGN15254.1 MAG: preprotein translocase subunit SecG [Candidatus Yanofskybacteria bacterium RIFCSPHIGHO2_02_FULL_44_12b]OGN26916.1 MAG: preprotein translocase subunit SecG [Candidatus Yanofskybacteria bacterium RIFCSPLOWO2_01_FULL_44_22]